MAKHRSRPARRRLSGALAAVNATVLGVLLTLSAGGWPAAGPTPDRAGALGMVDAVPSVVAEAMREHRCSSTGFGASVQPAGALVRTVGGRLRAVTFEEGWAVFTGGSPGTLVAVCLDAPRAERRG